MVAKWANSGVDLQVNLGAGRRGLRDALERELRSAIAEGRLVTGTMLPPSRVLATDLGVARNTVSEAYSQLIAEGWLVARRGSETRVATRLSAPNPPKPLKAPAAGSAVTPPVSLRYDLRAGFPDLASFPRTAWLAAARTALNQAPAVEFGYGWPAGLPELRASLAAYLGRARAVHATADQVVVTPGFTSALTTVATVLGHQGARRIGVEAYGHERHRMALRAAGLTVVPLTVDDEGAVTDSLEGLDAVVLTAAHQFPLGPALSTARRTAFAAWAIRTGGLIIEDDYDGEFRYDRRALGAVQGLAPDHVVYAGTASKTLSPGLRLGWLVLPDRLVEPVATVQAAGQSAAGVIEQLTLAKFIDGGQYDRHVRGMRAQYRLRRDRLLAGLDRRVPGSKVIGTSAGLHVTMLLPAHLDEAEVVARAVVHDLAIEGLRTFAVEAVSDRQGLAIGYGTPPPHLYSSAVARLLAVLESFSSMVAPTNSSGTTDRETPSLNASIRPVEVRRPRRTSVMRPMFPIELN